MASLTSRTGLLARFLQKRVASDRRGARGSIIAVAATLRGESTTPGKQGEGAATVPSAAESTTLNALSQHASGEYLNNVSIPFSSFVLSRPKQFLGFIREVLEVLPTSYHMCIVPKQHVQRYLDRPTSQWSSGEIAGFIESEARHGDFVLFALGHSESETQPAPSFKSNSEDPVMFRDRDGRCIEPSGGVTFGHLHISKSEYTKTSLDAQGRNMYIIVMKDESLREMRQLDDEQLVDLWAAAVRVSVSDSGDGYGQHSGDGYGHVSETSADESQELAMTDRFLDMRINAGHYQNIGHLHLKVSMPAEEFFDRWVGYWPWRRLMTATPSKSLRSRCLNHAIYVESSGGDASEKKRYWTSDRLLRTSLGLCAIAVDDEMEPCSKASANNDVD